MHWPSVEPGRSSAPHSAHLLSPAMVFLSYRNNSGGITFSLTAEFTDLGGPVEPM